MNPIEFMGIEGDAKPSEQPRHQPAEGGQPTAQRERFWDLKASHWVEVFLTVVLICVGCLQYRVYTRQAGIMEMQTHISKIDKRPWVRSTVTIAPPLRFSDWDNQKSITASLHVDLKNYGESPAVNVRVGAQIVRHPGNQKRSELSAPQEETCERARIEAAKNPVGGIAIFPNDPDFIESNSGLPSIYNSGEPILFAIVGCVVYTFAETERGETGFRMMLGRVSKNKIVGLPFIEGPPEPYIEPIPSELLAKGFPTNPPKIGLMQPNDFILRPEDEGNYAK
jgi:hypothetical protein